MILSFPSEGSPQVETLRSAGALDTFHPPSETVLELETELDPSLFIVVVLGRFRSKLQDFCDVCRRHILCANFLLRCDTIDDSGGA